MLKSGKTAMKPVFFINFNEIHKGISLNGQSFARYATIYSNRDMFSAIANICELGREHII